MYVSTRNISVENDSTAFLSPRPHEGAEAVLNQHPLSFRIVYSLV
jgi:hypothetical protein